MEWYSSRIFPSKTNPKTSNSPTTEVDETVSSDLTHMCESFQELLNADDPNGVTEKEYLILIIKKLNCNAPSSNTIHSASNTAKAEWSVNKSNTSAGHSTSNLISSMVNNSSNNELNIVFNLPTTLSTTKSTTTIASPMPKVNQHQIDMLHQRIYLILIEHDGRDPSLKLIISNIVLWDKYKAVGNYEYWQKFQQWCNEYDAKMATIRTTKMAEKMRKTQNIRNEMDRLLVEAQRPGIINGQQLLEVRSFYQKNVHEDHVDSLFIEATKTLKGIYCPAPPTPSSTVPSWPKIPWGHAKRYH